MHGILACAIAAQLNANCQELTDSEAKTTLVLCRHFRESENPLTVLDFHHDLHL